MTLSYTHTTFSSFNEAAKAIVAGEIYAGCAHVNMFSDIVNREVVFTGREYITNQNQVEFKPDSARVSMQYGFAK